MHDGKNSTDIRLETLFGREQFIGGKKFYQPIWQNWLVPPKHGHSHRPNLDNEGTYKRKGPLDVKVLELEDGIAWQLEISAYSRLHDIHSYQVFSDFIKNLSLEATTGEPPAVNFMNLHGLQVKSVVVKTKSSWFMVKSPYLFDVTKYEFYFHKHTPDGVAASTKGGVPDTRYGASMSNREWNNKVGAQFSLKMGKTAKWVPMVKDFFESSGIGGVNDPVENDVPVAPKEWEDGFTEFTGRVKDCVGMILRARKSAERRAEMGRRGVHEDDMD